MICGAALTSELNHSLTNRANPYRASQRAASGPDGQRRECVQRKALPYLSFSRDSVRLYRSRLGPPRRTAAVRAANCADRPRRAGCRPRCEAEPPLLRASAGRHPTTPGPCSLICTARIRCPTRHVGVSGDPTVDRRVTLPHFVLRFSRDSGVPFLVGVIADFCRGRGAPTAAGRRGAASVAGQDWSDDPKLAAAV